MNNFLLKCKEAARILQRAEKITVFGHRDTDGICASLLIKQAFPTKKVEIVIIRHGPSFEELAQKSDGTLPVFVDYGSSEIPNISSHFKEFLILDHHPTKQQHKWMVNPWDFGIDGTRELSGAGVVYFVVCAVSENNKRFSPFAVIGAMGDKQYLSGFKGPNSVILDDLFSERLAQGKRSSELIILTTPFSKDPVLALEVANIIDACASINKPYVAVEMMMGSIEAYNEARGIFKDYRKMHNDFINAILSRKEDIITSNSQHLAYFIHCSALEPGFSGAIAEDLVAVFPDKPIVILFDALYGIKASARTTEKLVKAGVDLGKAMERGTLHCGGKGGGHDIAAGAMIPSNRIEEFKAEVTYALFNQTQARLKFVLEIDVKNTNNANSILKALSVDNEKYKSTESIIVAREKKSIVLVRSDDIGTFRNTVDDIISCLSSCTEILNIKSKKF